MRNPIVELYRLVLMFGVVLLHTIQLAGFGSSPLARFLGVSVPGFIFISGWYGIRFSWWKVLRLYGLGVFCTLVACVCSFVFFGGTISGGQILVMTAKDLWFLNAYIILMCFAPTLNIAATSKGYYVPLLIVVFIWSFLLEVPVIRDYIPWAEGMTQNSPLTLIGIYTAAKVGRYMSVERRISTIWLVLLSVVSGGLSCLGLARYNSLIALGFAGSIFLLLIRINFSADALFWRLVLFLSPSVFSVYLISGGSAGFALVRELLTAVHAPPLLATMIVASCVFIVCVLIDIIRRRVLSYVV